MRKGEVLKLGIVPYMEGKEIQLKAFERVKKDETDGILVYKLEETIIKLLEEYGIKAGRKPKYTGVWVGDEKICAIGIAVRRWITWHGIAFNVNTDLSYFGLINACGITEFGVTSMQKLGINEDIEKVKEKNG
ncbi:octanoyltransferase LipB [Thermoanaerobacter kivui]|uniref:lipoyl(octanoyl) transferase n=1 Tax=Thermoanaerobacter kivui TaxID=2325 RepID=A0A097ASG7_THEKI|nr:octanoyltransferase LipB [Thermoanaerobacter kivui]